MSYINLSIFIIYKNGTKKINTVSDTKSVFFILLLIFQYLYNFKCFHIFHLNNIINGNNYIIYKLHKFYYWHPMSITNQTEIYNIVISIYYII